MGDATGIERLVEMLLVGTPERVLDGYLALSPGDAPVLAALRETLVSLASAVPPALPPPSLRERLLLRRPRPLRPKRPVLLVLDMIQDYLNPGGPLEVPRARDVVPAIQRRIEEARSSAVPVIFVCDTHPPDDPDFRDWPRHAVEGTPGAEVWPELAPKPEDHVVRKRTYSAFTGSRLGDLLDDLAADQIILTGCATEVGLAATAHDALQRGFVVTVPPDAQAGASFLGEQVTLLTLSAMPPFEPRYLRSAA
jgi:nicotinamidase-related amidase